MMSSPKWELWRKGGSLLRDAFEDEEENGWTWPNKKSNILNKKFRNRSRVIADGMKENRDKLGEWKGLWIALDAFWSVSMCSG